MNNEMKKVENNLNNDILDTIIGAMTGSPDNICVNDTNNTKFDFIGFLVVYIILDV